MTHPYRDPSPKDPSPKRSRLKAAAKAFAIAGSLWASYECSSRAMALGTELRNDQAYSRASAYGRAARDLEDARSALVHTPGLTAVICTDNLCFPLITPETYPDTARAAELLQHAVSAVPDTGIRGSLGRIRARLPPRAVSGDDIRLCSELRDELGQAGQALAQERAQSIGAAGQRTEKARDIYILAAALSMVSAIALISSRRRKPEAHESSASS